MAKQKKPKPVENQTIAKLQNDLISLVAHHVAAELTLDAVPVGAPDPAGLRPKAILVSMQIERQIALLQRRLADELTGTSIKDMVLAHITSGMPLPPMPIVTEVLG